MIGFWVWTFVIVFFIEYISQILFMVSMLQENLIKNKRQMSYYLIPLCFILYFIDTYKGLKEENNGENNKSNKL